MLLYPTGGPPCHALNHCVGGGDARQPAANDDDVPGHGGWPSRQEEAGGPAAKVVGDSVQNRAKKKANYMGNTSERGLAGCPGCSVRHTGFHPDNVCGAAFGWMADRQTDSLKKVNLCVPLSNDLSPEEALPVLAFLL